MRLVMDEKDMDDDKAQLRWRRHRDVMLKVCKGKYEGARLPAYEVTAIRDLHQFPKLKALLAFTIIANHNHAQARIRKEPVTKAPYEVEQFFSNEFCTSRIRTALNFPFSISSRKIAAVLANAFSKALAKSG